MRRRWGPLVGGQRNGRRYAVVLALSSGQAGARTPGQRLDGRHVVACRCDTDPDLPVRYGVERDPPGAVRQGARLDAAGAGPVDAAALGARAVGVAVGLGVGSGVGVGGDDAVVGRPFCARVPPVTAVSRAAISHRPPCFCMRAVKA